MNDGWRREARQQREVSSSFPVPSSSLLFLAALIVLAVNLFGADIRWEPLNEPGCGGWVTSLSVSPHDTRRVLVGGDMLGVGLSEDQGEHWQSTFGFKSWEIGDFTWHPKDPSIVWAGTMSGPYVSTDGGRNWQERRQGFPAVSEGMYTAPIEKALIDPNDASHLIAMGGSSRGWQSPGKPRWGAIWESRDGGQTWKHLCTLTSSGSSTDVSATGLNIVSATFAPSSSEVLYAAVRGAGFYSSTNGGKTWTVSNSGLSGTNIERVVAHPQEPKTLWACMNNHKAQGAKTCVPGGIYKSTDGGATWTAISKGLGNRSAPEDHFSAGYKALVVSPSNPDVMYTCDTAWNTGVIYRTVDGGNSWLPVATKQNIGQNEKDPARRALLDARKVEVAHFSGVAMTCGTCDPRDPNVVYMAGSEYILRTLDGGKTWTDATAEKLADHAWRGRGYSGLCDVNFRFDPFRKDHAILCAMDAGKCWESRDSLKTWTFRGSDPNPWGGGGDAVFTRGDTIYATTGQFGGNGGVLRTTDGTNWAALTGKKFGLPEFQGQGTANGIYTLPDDPQKVWVVFGGRLYHSTNGGERFEQLKCGRELNWIAGDPTKLTRFYVSGARNVYMTEDGEKFTGIGGPKVAGRMTVDSQGRLYLAAWRGQRPGLWRYDTGRWARLRDDFYLANVAVDPANPERLAAIANDDPYHDHCSARGVWVSCDGGASWSPASDGLVMLRGHAIAFDSYNSERLVCGTQGRGYFVARWPQNYKPSGMEKYVSTAQDVAFAAENWDKIQPVEIKNGAMTQGDAVPAEWTGKWGEGKVKRDTEVFKEGPASLCVEVAGGKSCQAFQQLSSQGGETFKLHGWVKAMGKVKVNVAVQSFDEGWTKNNFDQVKFLQNDADWTEFEKEVTIPDWAARCNVVLLVEGDGKAWLDEVGVGSAQK